MWYRSELYHYGVLGMKWGVRKDRKRAKLKRKLDIQFFASQKAKKRRTFHVSKKDYAILMDELRRNVTKEERNQPVIKKPIGDHIWYFENGFDGITYRPIGKKPIKNTATGLFDREGLIKMAKRRNKNFEDAVIKLIPKLRMVHDDRMFILGVLACVSSIEDVEKIELFLENGEEISDETVTVFALNMSDGLV